MKSFLAYEWKKKKLNTLEKKILNWIKDEEKTYLFQLFFVLK